MAIDKKTVRTHFNLNAERYDTCTVLQKFIAGRLASLIKKNGEECNVLEIGCGTGYFTRLLLEKFPNGTITAVDISEKMLAAAKTNLGWDGKARLVQGDGEHMPFEGPFDCIVSASTFQWFNNLEKTFQVLAALLRPGGQLIFSTFVEGTLCELFACFEECSREEGTLFARPAQTLHAPERLRSHLRRAGFSITTFSENERRVSFLSFAAFHSGIKRTGASNANRNRRSVPRSIARKIARRYAEDYPNDSDGITATYKMVFFAGERLG